MEYFQNVKCDLSRFPESPSSEVEGNGVDCFIVDSV